MRYYFLFVNPINMSTDQGIKKGAHNAGDTPAKMLSNNVINKVSPMPISPIFILLFMCFFLLQIYN